MGPMHYFSVQGGANGRWENIEPVPGGKGRLAASAVAAGGEVYVFGGYTVAQDGASSPSRPFTACNGSLASGGIFQTCLCRWKMQTCWSTRIATSTWSVAGTTWAM